MYPTEDEKLKRAFAAGMSLAERLCALTGRKGCHIVLADTRGKARREESLNIDAWGPSRGDGEPPKAYIDFARRKVATSAWHRMDTQTLNMNPHLYRKGKIDCIYPGSVCFKTSSTGRIILIVGTSGCEAVDDVSVSQVTGMTYLQQAPERIQAIVEFALNRVDPNYGPYFY